MADQRITASYSSRYTFTGKEQDALTGLQYFGARYYDARISLWYGVDPMAEKYPSWNPYNYTINNPVNLIDPDGMDIEIKPKLNDDTNFKNRTFDELQKLTSQKLKLEKGGKISILEGEVGNENATAEGTKLISGLINDKKKMTTITNDFIKVVIMRSFLIRIVSQ